MKKLAYVCLFSFCMASLCACNKSEPGLPGEPEPLLNRLDSMMSADGPLRWKTFFYDDNNRFLIDGISEDGTTYSYNNEGLVSKIRIAGSAPPSGILTDITINYQNGLPVSGKLFHAPYSNKEANPIVWTDSILYKVMNGKVTEIKYLDRKEYARYGGQQVRFLPGTRAIHTLTYTGNNLSKIETANASFAKEMTYGTRKSILYPYRQKFVLWENENPALHAENDLTSIIEPKGTTWEKTTYIYQYNTAGYPKSSIVSHTNANGQILRTYNWKYHYK